MYGKPNKTDCIGCYLDPHSGEVRQIAYRMPIEKKAGKNAKKADDNAEPDAPAPKIRPEVTQRGRAMIGDFWTDALHEALRENDLSDETLIALLVLALSGRNVTIVSGADRDGWDRKAIGERLIEGGILTSDQASIRKAAREMLITALSCRDNMSKSGAVARVAGEVVSAPARLPNMASEEFLACLSREALERAAAAEGVPAEVRVKDTRTRMVGHFKDATYLYPGAQFALTPEEIADLAEATEARTSDQADAYEDTDEVGISDDPD